MLQLSSVDGVRFSCRWGSTSRLFVGIRYRILLPQPVLRPLFGDLVFYERLFSIFGLPRLDKSRVPELGGDSQIFTAAYHSVGFAAFGSSWDTVLREIVLFATGDAY